MSALETHTEVLEKVSFLVAHYTCFSDLPENVSVKVATATRKSEWYQSCLRVLQAMVRDCSTSGCLTSADGTRQQLEDHSKAHGKECPLYKAVAQLVGAVAGSASAMVVVVHDDLLAAER